MVRLLFDGPLPPTGARIAESADLLNILQTDASVPAPGATAIADWATATVHAPLSVLLERLAHYIEAVRAGLQAFRSHELVATACTRAPLALGLGLGLVDYTT